MNAALLRCGYLLAVNPPALRKGYVDLLEQARLDDSPLTDFLAQREVETQEQLLWLLDDPQPEQGPRFELK